MGMKVFGKTNEDQLFEHKKTYQGAKEGTSWQVRYLVSKSKEKSSIAPKTISRRKLDLAVKNNPIIFIYQSNPAR